MLIFSVVFVLCSDKWGPRCLSWDLTVIYYRSQLHVSCLMLTVITVFLWPYWTDFSHSYKLLKQAPCSCTKIQASGSPGAEQRRLNCVDEGATLNGRASSPHWFCISQMLLLLFDSCGLGVLLTSNTIILQRNKILLINIHLSWNKSVNNTAWTQQEHLKLSGSIFHS